MTIVNADCYTLLDPWPSDWAVECLIANTSSGPVFDPFLGSGTSAIACANLGREFVGVEIDPDVCAFAQARLAQHLKQGQLF